MTRKMSKQLKNEQVIEQVNEQAVNKHCTSTEQVYIDINNTNSINDISK